MPALVVFNRRWRIGSDDLVIPGIIEVFLRFVWLGLTTALLVQHESDTSRCSSGSHLLRLFLLGSLVLQGVTLVITMLLVVHSCRGTIVNTLPRKHVPALLVTRVVFGIPEVVWNFIGSAWIVTGQIECEPDTALPVLMKALVIYTWIAIALILLGILLLFDPMKRPSRQGIVEGGALRSHYIQLWEKRCRLLCCVRSQDDNISEAFKNVADVFASLFEDLDLVASDLAAAMVLLRLKRKYEEQREESFRKIDRHLPISRSSTASIGTLQDEGRLPFQQSPRPEWMKVGSAEHFMKFAMASYGWPWFMYHNICQGCCSMKSHLMCCSCCRSPPRYVMQDNCCLCHTAALKALTGLSEENITYITFHNKIYEVPFFIAIDDETQNVVLAIRGTLSLHDAITDLNAQCIKVEGEGLPEGCMAHKGMVQTARSVLTRLDSTRALAEACSSRPGYGLVITGHSLGAGAVLSVLPYCGRATQASGALPSHRLGDSAPGNSHRQLSFVMSVVVGDDLVPRLSMNSLHDLRHKIKCVLDTCSEPKYRVLAQGCWYMLFGISTSSLHSANSVDSPAQDRPLLEGSGNSFTYQSTPPVQESVDDVQVMFSEPDPQRPHVPRHTETPLFPPGRILYCFPSLPEQDRLEGSVGDWEYTWSEAKEFSQILISPFMMRHHLPPNVLRALRDAASEAADPT
ncbi:Sn1-specific diacylglycerol lipase beta [Chionoecetes opilio]|uniref:sn-1-specific diacylglycerol lipase n=1 Tax=Chionoecetes opilio TaxID=41210 RepID=A0A8J4YDB6_CHIOP|nr:Sn1-specific diacylglycerol lipase beta [Chionoecetes opilio]